MTIIIKCLGSEFIPLFNAFIIFLDTFDATVARNREDADDAIAAKVRMEDVVVYGAVVATVANYHEDVAGAIAAKSRVETVAADDAVAAATVANYREDAAGAIATRLDQNS